MYFFQVKLRVFRKSWMSLWNDDDDDDEDDDDDDNNNNKYKLTCI